MIKELNRHTLKDGAAIPAIPSKSEAHRILICAALSDTDTEIVCPQTSQDIEATISCLVALGASVKRKGDVLCVSPIEPGKVKKGAVLDCGESGSTLRFMLTLACVLGSEPEFVMHGRLSERPMGALCDELAAHGVVTERLGNRLICHGVPHGSEYTLSAGISSQFVSSLLFALPLCDSDSVLRLVGKTESEGYIDMTLETVERFGINIEKKDSNKYIIHRGRYTSPKKIKVGGDWSNAAFWLCAGAVGGSCVTVTGLDMNSAQRDRTVIDVLKSMGADIHCTLNSSVTSSVTVSADRKNLHGTRIDASQIPDLIPVLSTVAAVSEGKTEIYNAARLRHKESDRITSVCAMLNAFGASVTELPDGIIINGSANGFPESPSRIITVNSFNDHRIAMSAAIAALACDKAQKVIIDGAEAVNKSYPHFFEDYESITKETERTDI